MSERKNTKYYYNVALSLAATWNNNSYTYYSSESLAKGTIVKAPFGKNIALGIVLGKIDKPEFEVKELENFNDFVLPEQSMKLIQWMNKLYPSAPGVQTQLFLPSIIKSINKDRIKKFDDLTKIKDQPLMSKDQLAAYSKITSESVSKTKIVHGITGSGKTRLYIELAKKCLENSENVLILYPEISLTKQLQQTLADAFGEDIVNVYHSKRTTTEQKRTWLSVLVDNKPQITIGPRSAIFLPHNNLGLIIVDEAHDSAYKQDSGSRYNGLIAAGALAKIHNAKLILASATPPVQETRQILSKGGDLVCMHSLAKPSEFGDKEFMVIDMKESKNRTQYSLLSKKLLEQVDKSLREGKQSLLFLNRRGTAKLLICENCGWHAECPDCEMPLTYHHDSFKLQCHVCGYSRSTDGYCPDCKNNLALKNFGTKAIEEDLKNIFPNAKVARYDSDNKKAESLSENFLNIERGDIDILIGTQLITKGLDLPKLETVGVLNADSSLLLPDYSSEERTFQQLTQVSGRVGRGHSKGTVIIQTYQPDSFIFKYVSDQDWHGFYEQELQKRKSSNYPPFSYAMKIWISKSSSQKSKEVITKVFDQIKRSHKEIRILGPAPGFHSKVGGNYNWQIVVLSSSRTKLSDIARDLPSGFMYDLDPISLL